MRPWSASIPENGWKSTAPLLMAAGLLVLFGWETHEIAGSSSATADEPIYIRSGLLILDQGDVAINDISSPFLFKALNALPLLGWDGIRSADTGPDQACALADWPPLLAQWRAGVDWVQSVGPQKILPRARWVPRLTGLAAGLLILIAGWWILGAWAGCLGLAVYVLLPEAVAHASLATLEPGLALTTFLTLVVFARYLRDRSHAFALLCGVGLGLTLITKTTGVVLALFLFLVMAVQFLVRKGDRVRILIGLAILMVSAWFVLNLAFAFEGSFDPAVERTDYHEIHARLVQLPAPLFPAVKWCVEHLPLLLPESFVHTLLTQMAIAGKGKRIFFNGEQSSSGWWWLMGITFLIKMPIPFLLLVLAGAWLLKRAGPLRVFVGFALFLLAFFSLMSRVNPGVRYLYPALPGLCVLSGCVLALMA